MLPSATTLLVLVSLFPAVSQSRTAVQGQSPPAVDATRASSSLRVYDVRPALSSLTPPRSNAQELLDDLHEESDFEEQLRATNERLAAWAQRFMQPSWDPETNRIECLASTELLLQATAEQHAWVARWLQLLASETPGFMSVSTTILELPRGDLESLELGRPMGVATAAEARLLVGARQGAAERKGWNLLSAPRTMTRPFEKATVSILNQIAYIKEFEVNMSPDGASLVVDPIISVVQEGLSLDLCCGPIESGVLGLTVTLDRASVETPIASRKLRVSTHPPTEVEVQTPLVDHVKQSTWHRVPDGGLIYFTTPSDEADRDLLFLIEASAASELR